MVKGFFITDGKRITDSKMISIFNGKMIFITDDSILPMVKWFFVTDGKMIFITNGKLVSIIPIKVKLYETDKYISKKSRILLYSFLAISNWDIINYMWFIGLMSFFLTCLTS